MRTHVHTPLRKAAAFVLAVMLATLPMTTAAQAQGLLRDAETEHIIRSYATPIFAAAGLGNQDITIYLVADDSLNAFVAGGQNLFINSGLLLEFGPEEVIGVIAHETGHIAGGHLTRVHDAMRNAGAATILGMVLGVGAIVAGAGEVGTAIIAGSQQVGQQTFLKYTRTQESAADQAAVTYLDQVGMSGEGLLEVLRNFSGQEIMTEQQQDAYIRTHPLSLERIGLLQERVEKSDHRGARVGPEVRARHARMQAKLYGYVKKPILTFRKFPDSDQSVPARYARAYAYLQQSKLDSALAEVNSLVNDDPNDPFFLELKGQVLFESGRVAASVAPHRRSVELAPGIPQLRVNLAQSLLATDDPANATEAQQNLEIALKADPSLTFGWHQLAIAHDRQGNAGMAALASAERFARAGAPAEARLHSERAIAYLPEGSPAWLRAKDISELSKPRRQR